MQKEQQSDLKILCQTSTMFDQTMCDEKVEKNQQQTNEVGVSRWAKYLNSDDDEVVY
jgi:hypothetical protein